MRESRKAGKRQIDFIGVREQCELALRHDYAILTSVKPTFPLLVASLLLCHCNSFLPGRADGIDPNPFELLEKQATAENRDSSRIRVPVLYSPALEKRWGKPKLLVGPKGGYALRYASPKNPNTHLTIFGSPSMFSPAGATPPPYTDLGMDAVKQTFVPQEVSQKWRHIRIAGQNVRYYVSEGISDEQPLQFSTETFRFSAPDGRTASYRIRTASKSKNPEESIEKLLKSVSLR